MGVDASPPYLLRPLQSHFSYTQSHREVTPTTREKPFQERQSNQHNAGRYLCFRGRERERERGRLGCVTLFFLISVQAHTGNRVQAQVHAYVRSSAPAPAPAQKGKKQCDVAEWDGFLARKHISSSSCLLVVSPLSRLHFSTHTDAVVEGSRVCQASYYARFHRQ